MAVRASLSLRMTSAFFLDGHWAKVRGEIGGNQASSPTDFVFPTAGALARQDNDSPRTTLLSCRLATVEAFSRPLVAGGGVRGSIIPPQGKELFLSLSLSHSRCCLFRLCLSGGGGYGLVCS